MLFFSTGILTYTGLFQSREAAYLLTTPASTDRIFAYKFFEAIGFSSWGFLLLGSPMMVAYGITVQASPAFYAIFLLYLLVVRADPRQPGGDRGDPGRQLLPEAAEDSCSGSAWPLVLAAAIVLAVRLVQTPGATLSSDWLGGLLGRLAFSQHPLWPSRWMSAGLLASARGDWSAGLFYLMVLTGHAALAYLVGRGRRPRPLPPGLQPGPGGAVVAPPDRLVRVRRRSSTALFFFLPRPDPPADPQGPADLPPRPGAVVAVPDLLRPAGLLLRQHPPAELRRPEPVLAEPGQLPEPGGDRADPLDVHQPVHLPAALAGGAELLGPRPAAAGARGDPLGQVRVRVGHLAGGDRAPGRPERPDAPDGPGDDRAAHGDGGRPLPRASRGSASAWGPGCRT